MSNPRVRQLWRTNWILVPALALFAWALMSPSRLFPNTADGEARGVHSPAAATPGAAAAGHATTTPRAHTITIVATGEILPHPSVVASAAHAATKGHAYDFAPMFRLIAPTIAGADLAICHLEVPVAPAGTKLSGYPDFGIPAEIGAGIHAAGWNRCSTASNHSYDRGIRGVEATLDALDAAKVAHSGSARTPQDAAKIPISVIHGIHVAHLAYAWGFNGNSPVKAWRVNVIDRARILADAAAAKRAGADLVIVSLHWGTEYRATPDPAQRALAEALLASPNIDLIIGHGPHVLQPIEQFHGKWALMSMGNLVSNQGASRPSTYDGGIASITFTADAQGHFHAAAPTVKPTWYDRTAGVVRLVGPAIHDATLTSVHSALVASLHRTTLVFGAHIDLT